MFIAQYFPHAESRSPTNRFLIHKGDAAIDRCATIHIPSYQRASKPMVPTTQPELETLCCRVLGMAFSGI